MRKTLVCMTILASSLTLANAAIADTGNDTTLAALADGEHRSEANKARNQYRHPAQTLEFFGLHPDMTVVELWPGGGWYTEVIAPYMSDSGQFVAASFETDPAPEDDTPAYRVRLGKAYQQKLADSPDLYGGAKVLAFDPPRKSSLGVEASADMVLTFRNLHNWSMDGQLETVFRSAFEVLSPGGVFGVVEHRGKPGMPAKSGYMEESEVIKLAESVGFKLAAKSEINANAKDTKDHPKGVWTLPPSLRLKDVDREKYLAIGESDRMTLKFYKPEI